MLEIEIDLPSSERRRLASAVVKTVILEEEGRGGKVVLVMNQRHVNGNISTNGQTAIIRSVDNRNLVDMAQT